MRRGPKLMLAERQRHGLLSRQEFYRQPTNESKSIDRLRAPTFVTVGLPWRSSWNHRGFRSAYAPALLAARLQLVFFRAFRTVP